MTIFVENNPEKTAALSALPNRSKRMREAKAAKLKRGARSGQEKKAPLSDVWTAEEATSAKSIREKMKKTDYLEGLPTNSTDGLVKVLKERKERRTKATDTDFVEVFATVVQAKNDNERQVMYEAACTVLGKKRYKNSNLVSLMLQALEFEPDKASKRGTISRYAMRMKIAPGQLLEFVKKEGGLEQCKKNALDFEELTAGTVQVGLVVKSADTNQRHVLYSFKYVPLIEAVQEFYQQLKPDRQEIARVVDASIVKRFQNTAVKKKS